MAIRHRSRHLRATIKNKTVAELTTLGWIDKNLGPINFNADPIVVLDYQPDERGEIITTNTVAVSIGDVINDVDEEMGAGLRSAWYPVFIDVYMDTQALSDAVCDDIRDIFDTRVFPLVNQIDQTDTDQQIEIEEVIGPDRPAASGAAEQFKRYWRVMRLGVRLYYVP
jgi:hypothetical protein